MYLGSVQTTLKPAVAGTCGGGTARTTTQQTLDAYGNLTESDIFDYNNTTNKATRTYKLSYLTDSNYTSRYIRNRLVSATVTPSGSTAVTLASNSYDQAPLTDRSGSTLHDPAYSTGFGLSRQSDHGQHL